MRVIARDPFARTTLIRETIQRLTATPPVLLRRRWTDRRRRAPSSSASAPSLTRFIRASPGTEERFAPGPATTPIATKKGSRMHRTVHAHLCLPQETARRLDPLRPASHPPLARFITPLLSDYLDGTRATRQPRRAHPPHRRVA